MTSQNNCRLLVIKPRQCMKKRLLSSQCTYLLPCYPSPQFQVTNVIAVFRFLSDPHAKTDNICRLTLLQSLIIELGLGTSSALPPTLTAAKAFLKARAFLNIREYMAVRGQGSEAVRSVMYPSKSALVKSIKKKRNATPLKWVKELGLQVLLVGFMH